MTDKIVCLAHAACVLKCSSRDVALKSVLSYLENGERNMAKPKVARRPSPSPVVGCMNKLNHGLRPVRFCCAGRQNVHYDVQNLDRFRQPDLLKTACCGRFWTGMGKICSPKLDFFALFEPFFHVWCLKHRWNNRCYVAQLLLKGC